MKEKYSLFFIFSISLLFFTLASSTVVAAEYVAGQLMCTDNDGGDAPNESGIVFIEDSANNYSSDHADMCINNSLVEYYCIDSSGRPSASGATLVEYEIDDPYSGLDSVFQSGSHECALGCNDGACVQEGAPDSKTPPAETNSASKAENPIPTESEDDKEPPKRDDVHDGAESDSNPTGCNIPEFTYQYLSATNTIKIAHVHGAVDVEGIDGGWKEAKEEMILKPGEKVYTAPFANIVIIIGYTVFEIGPNTEIEIVVDESGIKIMSGTVRVKRCTGHLKMNVSSPGVKTDPIDYRSDMNVVTPNATASPRGTDFTAGHIDGRSIIELYDGELEITNNITKKSTIIYSAYGEDPSRVAIDGDGTVDTALNLSWEEEDAYGASLIISVIVLLTGLFSYIYVRFRKHGSV